MVSFEMNSFEYDADVDDCRQIEVVRINWGVVRLFEQAPVGFRVAQWVVDAVNGILDLNWAAVWRTKAVVRLEMYAVEVLDSRPMWDNQAAVLAAN